VVEEVVAYEVEDLVVEVDVAEVEAMVVLQPLTLLTLAGPTHLLNGLP